MAEELEERSLGATTVLYGKARGKYPHGNSLLVRGAEETAVIDPSLGLIPRVGRLPTVDRILNSHCHEDHVAGNHLFPDAAVHLHAADLVGLESIDAFMAIYGFSAEVESVWRKMVVEEFFYQPRSDAQAFEDGAVFDLGGGVRIHVIHTPGHTRGHCALRIEPDDILYLGDIDLSSFGPYYGDAWSCLEDFEASLRVVRRIEARHYATFHHIGVIDERERFLERLDRYAAVIADREARLLAYLDTPRSLEEIVEHRFVYRPGDAVAFAAPVERRSMSQHLDRLVAVGRVSELDGGRYRAVV